MKAIVGLVLGNVGKGGEKADEVLLVDAAISVVTRTGTAPTKFSCGSA